MTIRFNLFIGRAATLLREIDAIAYDLVACPNIDAVACRESAVATVGLRFAPSNMGAAKTFFLMGGTPVRQLDARGKIGN